MNPRILLILMSLILVGLIGYGYFASTKQVTPPTQLVTSPTLVSSSPSPQPSVQSLPQSKVIPQKKQVFQTFNNCGPAALSMALSYLGIDKSQAELGNQLRPYQTNPPGMNDDKSVTLYELADWAKENDLVAFYRPNGSLDTLKKFISNDIPVLTRTWLKENEDIGHYRLVRGFDEDKQTLVQDDSLQGASLTFSYQQFNALWQPFNSEYLVIVPKEKASLVQEIIGEDIDESLAWKKTLAHTQQQLSENPQDMYAMFNQSVAYYHLGEYQKSAESFEKVESRLPSRMLWYQIEPIQAFQKIKNYDKVFQLTNSILNNQNRAFSELYIIRGEIYLEQGQKTLAKQEFEKALFYNTNLKIAKEALTTVN